MEPRHAGQVCSQSSEAEFTEENKENEDRMRPFEQQSTLERWIRAALWHPTDALRRAKQTLPGAVKQKNYALAAQCQEIIRASTHEISRWQDFLNLYEAEFHRVTT